MPRSDMTTVEGRAGLHARLSGPITRPLKTDYSVYENIRYPAPGYGEATPEEIERARRLLADARAAEVKRS